MKLSRGTGSNQTPGPLMPSAVDFNSRGCAGSWKARRSGAGGGDESGAIPYRISDFRGGRRKAWYFEGGMRNVSPAKVVLITASSPDEGSRIAEALVAERLAACVNRVDGISSVYWWKGKIERGSESLLVAKTRGELVERLIARVKELHSYSVPEVIVLPIEAGNADYLEWIDEETKG